MKFLKSYLSGTRSALVLAAIAFLQSVSWAVTIPSQPLSIQPSAKPMIMLLMARDHRLFFEAYNDASDLDGDGLLDIKFRPTITYLGLFNSDYCYTHNGTATTRATNSAMFVPTALATGTLKTCSGQWSGNWLNYVTTSRLDALKVVLYGGQRDTDNTTTVLRRTYIPQDAHSWAKEYTSLAFDGYRISDYTPLSQPASGRRHFFGNVTANAAVNCATLNDCSNLPPWLSVVENSTTRVWFWSATEQPVLRDDTHLGTRTNYTVRVQVCTAGFKSGCKAYPNGNDKPVGLLHDFGESEAALFGLMSGSFDDHMSGGKLRKVISSFKGEIDANTGSFVSDAPIVNTFNALRIRGFNQGNTSRVYSGTNVANRPAQQGEFPDWGNPFGEMLYEAVRYLAGKSSSTTAYNSATTIDDHLGFPKPIWDNPYSGTSAAKAPWCARANILGISDTNISFDSDQLPGVDSNFGSGISTDLTGRNIYTNVISTLHVSNIGNFITANEPGIVGSRFIGQSGANFDSSPSPKTVASLSSIRGLAPEEPTKRGSYYSASSAYFAKTHDLHTTLQGNQTVDSFFVALASPLPKIQAKLSSGKIISFVPFSKSMGGLVTNAPNRGNFLPTGQIVDFNVDSIENEVAGTNMAVNGGRFQASFRINFETMEQGNDFDMDAIVMYRIRVNADDSVTISVQGIDEAAGTTQRFGYVVSGSSADGVYIVAQSQAYTTPYFLNVPPGRAPGFCDTATPNATCNQLPFFGATNVSAPNTSISTVTFTAGTSASAEFLKDPLWYAAKWGGFNDYDGNGRPNLKGEWDLDNDGQPDTYFFVQNPTKMRDSLTRAFQSIVDRQGSSSNLAANVSGRIQTDSLVYRASYIAGRWTGEVEAIPVTINGLGSAPAWRASEKLPTWNSRNLYVQTGTSTVADMKVTGFSGLPAMHQAGFGSADTYAYVRGSAALEVKNGGSLRSRDTPLGDIIHSSPAFDLESQTLYVGSNSGFLHAFNGKTGVEKFGFMPRTVVPKIKNLANVTYSGAHEYFVDGENLLGYKLSQTNNSYYLYTMLGRGGKGMFSINPGVSATLPTLLWDYTAPTTSVGTSTLTLTTAEADPDLGLMLSSPAGSLMNNGKFGVFAGNGYNSASGSAVLYIFLINPDGSLDSVKKIDTGVAGDNGLSGPSGFDSNADGKVDFLYAGDLKGNVWRFDVRDVDEAKWKLSYTGGVPMFKATDGAGNPQPITSAVTPIYNNFGGTHSDKLYLTFGTGSYFKVGDNTDLSIQTWYGIIDDETGVGDGTPVPSTPLRGALVAREMSSPVTSTVTSAVIRYAGGVVANDLSGKRGWFIDLKNPINGERIITPNVFLPNAVKPLIQSPSIYPINNDVCTPGGDSYMNAIDPFTGGNLKEDVFLTAPSPGATPISVGPKVSNPSPLTGAQHTDLAVSSRRLSVGIATSPINLGTGGQNYTTDLWTSVLGVTYGSSDINISRSDFNRWNGRVAVKTEKSRKDCVNNLVSVVSGSEGIESSFLKGCDTNRIQGRISWREILKD